MWWLVGGLGVSFGVIDKGKCLVMSDKSRLGVGADRNPWHGRDKFDCIC